MSVKIRNYPESNYRALFFNGKTIRQKHDDSKPFASIPHPEIEDVAINSQCFANCSYCYTSATKKGKNFDDIVGKARLVWGTLSENDRPNQIAIGGAGESTIHPDWVEFVKTVKEIGIVPNYTTNGMHLSQEILLATEEHCGGVAVSYHPHIKNVFHDAIKKLSGIKTRLNTHIIVGDEKSFQDLVELYNMYKDVIEYFVILPYQAAGRATEIDTHETWKKTFEWIASMDSSESAKFAFGALFYEYIMNNGIPLKMSIYEPEIFSGYRIMDDSYGVLRKSSYDLNPKI
jgi:MoaA/NifB/PqqE/SkfB family radical SAM enzyme